MIRHITATVWSDEKEDFIEVPLDDAPNWIVRLAQLTVGTNMSDEEVSSLSDYLWQVDCVCGP